MVLWVSSSFFLICCDEDSFFLSIYNKGPQFITFVLHVRLDEGSFFRNRSVLSRQHKQLIFSFLCYIVSFACHVCYLGFNVNLLVFKSKLFCGVWYWLDILKPVGTRLMILSIGHLELPRLSSFNEPTSQPTCQPTSQPTNFIFKH